MGDLKGTGDEIDAKGDRMLPRDDTLYLRRNQLSAERRGQIRDCGVMKPGDRLRRSRLATRTRENHKVRARSS